MFNNNTTAAAADEELATTVEQENINNNTTQYIDNNLRMIQLLLQKAIDENNKTRERLLSVQLFTTFTFGIVLLVSFITIVKILHATQWQRHQRDNKDNDAENGVEADEDWFCCCCGLCLSNKQPLRIMEKAEEGTVIDGDYVPMNFKPKCYKNEQKKMRALPKIPTGSYASLLDDTFCPINSETTSSILIMNETSNDAVDGATTAGINLNNKSVSNVNLLANNEDSARDVLFEIDELIQKNKQQNANDDNDIKLHLLNNVCKPDEMDILYEKDEEEITLASTSSNSSNNNNERPIDVSNTLAKKNMIDIGVNDPQVTFARNTALTSTIKKNNNKNSSIFAKSSSSNIVTNDYKISEEKDEIMNSQPNFATKIFNLVYDSKTKDDALNQANASNTPLLNKITTTTFIPKLNRGGDINMSAKPPKAPPAPPTTPVFRFSEGSSFNTVPTIKINENILALASNSTANAKKARLQYNNIKSSIIEKANLIKPEIKTKPISILKNINSKYDGIDVNNIMGVNYAATAPLTTLFSFGGSGGGPVTTKNNTDIQMETKMS